MLLKRARDEAFTKHVVGNGIGNGAGNGHKRSSLSPTIQAKCAPSSLSCSSTQTLKPSPASKIVVNTFHGSSMLSAQQQEEKSRLLTQNGLTKSAATALETSLYASLYAHSPHNGQHHFTSHRATAGDHCSPYVGVSLNKGGHDHDRRHEDDPCAGGSCRRTRTGVVYSQKSLI